MATHAASAANGIHSAPTTNGSSESHFKVIIVGAGIAGLAAAIGLRQAGHDVEIFEQSSFSHEIGAAIHVCPNASRIILDWGVDPVKYHFDETKAHLMADAQTLKPVYDDDCNHIREKYKSPWFLTHRVDLHTSLKDVAFSPLGKGKPAKLHLKAHVVSIDDAAGTIILEDGSTHTADLVVAADGVHSHSVQQVLGYSNDAHATGSSAYRFLIPTEEILKDEQTRKFVEGKDGVMKVYIEEGSVRRIAWYPCRGGTLQNFVGIHPDRPESAAGAKEDWHNSSSKEDLIQEFTSFHPDLQAVIRKATDVKLWKLLYRAPIPQWFKNRLILIGDAAHPMLPHQGQGGAQSIEDGAALGILFFALPSGEGRIPQSVIASRLAAFQQLRRQRASLMQIYSNVGQDEAEKVQGEAQDLFGNGEVVPKTPTEFEEHNFNNDVRGEGAKALEECLQREQEVKGGEGEGATIGGRKLDQQPLASAEVKV